MPMLYRFSGFAHESQAPYDALCSIVSPGSADESPMLCPIWSIVFPVSPKKAPWAGETIEHKASQGAFVGKAGEMIWLEVKWIIMWWGGCKMSTQGWAWIWQLTLYDWHCWGKSVMRITKDQWMKWRERLVKMTMNENELCHAQCHAGSKPWLKKDFFNYGQNQDSSPDGR
jgi:hypothetical protein